MYARNPVPICYYNDDDKYRVQYFSLIIFFFHCVFFHHARYWHTFSVVPDIDRRDAVSLRSVKVNASVRHCQSHTSVCHYSLWCCTNWTGMWRARCFTYWLYICYHIRDKLRRNVSILLLFAKPTSLETTIKISKQIHNFVGNFRSSCKTVESNTSRDLKGRQFICSRISHTLLQGLWEERAIRKRNILLWFRPSVTYCCEGMRNLSFHPTEIP